jgi:hypothetical protein
MRPSKSSLFAVFFVAASSLLARSGHATSVHYRSLRDLVRGSDVTLLGHPMGQDSFWQGTRIMTRVRVAVEEVWAGAAPSRSYVDVISPGGVVGEIGQRVDGAAVLPADGQVVLHLHSHGDEYLPAAMAQGMWIVTRSPDGRTQSLLRPSADRVVFGLTSVRDTLPKDLSALRRAVLEITRAP